MLRSYPPPRYFPAMFMRCLFWTRVFLNDPDWCHTYFERQVQDKHSEVVSVIRGTSPQSACLSRESLWSANFYSKPSHKRSADILKLVSYLLLRWISSILEGESFMMRLVGNHNDNSVSLLCHHVLLNKYEQIIKWGRPQQWPEVAEENPAI